jgi:hypothetical protein
VFFIDLSKYTFNFSQVPLGGFKYHVLVAGDQQNPEPYYSHIQPQYAIYRVGRHLSSFGEILRFLNLEGCFPPPHLINLAVLVGKCAALYMNWVYIHPRKSRSESREPSFSSQTTVSFCSICDGDGQKQGKQRTCHSEGRMWDEVRSSIAEWVMQVPPGCPED